MPRHEPAGHLAWRTTQVRGRRVNYGVAGKGLPVLFIHGWALGSHAYKRALKRLVPLGCRVYAPALPGFGGSAPLRDRAGDMDAYAAWAVAFLDAVAEEEPVLAVGHSFGAAVAAKLAHEFPERVGHLVLINAVGGGLRDEIDGEKRSSIERPWWHWAVHFPMDVLAGRDAIPVLSAVLPDFLPNLVSYPLAVWWAAGLARRVDITADLVELRAGGVPIQILWGEGDSIIPPANFTALCAAAGSAGELVPGRHSWPLADPDRFARLMAGPVRGGPGGPVQTSGAAGPVSRARRGRLTPSI